MSQILLKSLWLLPCYALVGVFAVVVWGPAIARCAEFLLNLATSVDS
ncbi:MAG: hypothetical protein VKJ46_01815 [Leptolyngbyaceae bacterium]|nr:hypothetical protein [Leptolyngbyaceae bacterium]